jgi:DNA-binding MarR family transcriptional regulator
LASSGPAQAANLLGALALAVTDRVGETLDATVGRSQSAAAMLSALDQFLDVPTVDRLAQVLGLSQSGAVRLVDRLEHDGYVRRSRGSRGPDARSIGVHLTGAGRRAARRVRAQRLDHLDRLLDPLEEDERRQLAVLAGRLLAGMMREPGAVGWTCRLCDLRACGRREGRCPLEREARRRYG